MDFSFDQEQLSTVETVLSDPIFTRFSGIRDQRSLCEEFCSSTYHFPPRPASGSFRPIGLAKHLPRYGWEPIVLTPRLPDGPRPAVQIIETDYQDVLGQWKSRFGLDPNRGVHQQFSFAAGENWSFTAIDISDVAVQESADVARANGYAVTQHSRSASEVKSTGLAGDCRVYR